MDFKKYNSIENVYRIKFQDTLKRELLHDGQFVVQEKAHGANFSLWIDETHIRSAKRSGFLSGHELTGFYDALSVQAKYYTKLKELRDHLVETKGDVGTVTVYGELIGGSYPHPDVEKVKGTSRVQKGVFYCPGNEFFGFDIAVDGKLLPINESNELFEKFDFYYARPLFVGTYEQCLKYPKHFQTQIPKLFGLPEIENNQAEGVVIKPMNPKFTNGGSRVILKNKIEKFEEKMKVQAKKDERPPLEGKSLEYLNEMLSYINENRLRNVLSKIGPITRKDFGKIIKHFVADYTEDFLKDNEAFDADVEKEDRKRISKDAHRMAAQLIRDNMLNIIDGTF